MRTRWLDKKMQRMLDKWLTCHRYWVEHKLDGLYGLGLLTEEEHAEMAMYWIWAQAQRVRRTGR